MVTCLAFLAAVPGLVQGATTTLWTGSANSSWAEATNWDHGVPTVGYLARIENVANNPVSLTIPSSIDGLTIGTLNGLTLQGAVLQTGALTNDGTITLAGGTLTLQGAGPFTNSGLIQNAVGGLSQLGGNLTNTGTIAVSESSGLQFTGGSTYINDGLITLNAIGSVSDLRLYGGGTVTLGGAGSLTMTNRLDNQVFADTAGMSLVNEADHTITGAGVIGGSGAAFTLQNTGTITADGSAGLFFSPQASVVNTGTIQSGGGPLTFASGVTNTGGTIQADGSTVTFTGPAPVLGGTLAALHGGNLNFTGSLVQDADLNVGSASAATLTGATYTGGSMDIVGTLTLQGSTVSGSTVINSGLIRNATSSLGQLGGNVTNTGTIVVSESSGLQLTGGSTYINDGLITLNAIGAVSDLRLYGSGAVTLAGVGSLTMTNRLDNRIFADTAGMSLVNEADHTITGAGLIGGTGPAFTLQNEGTIAADGNAGLFFGLGTTLQNDGILSVRAGGEARIFGPFANFAGQTLTGGTYDIAGTWKFTGADIVTNAADITLDGPGARILDHASNNGLRHFSTNSGAFTLLDGATAPALGNFTNTGGLTVGPGTALTTANYHQTAGSTRIDGTLTTETFALDGGTLGGHGVIGGDLIVGAGGVVTPGGSPGLLTVNGNCTQDPLASLVIELGGLIRGDEYSALVVTDDLTLDGTLDVLLWDGFEPLAGDSFDVLDWGTLNGTFAMVHLPTLTGDLHWDASGLYTSGVLSVYSSGSVIPAPGAATLVLLGAGVLAVRRRRSS
jgi:fibronectin-binding autotransporter adhesin